VDPGDAHALAGAVRHLRGADLITMGKRAREALESRFDRPLATEAYRELLESVTAQA
jgi:hypothetical protein